MSRAKEVHVKQFKRTSGSHDSLRGMLGSGHLTSRTKVIFVEFDTLDPDDVLLLHKRVQVPHASMTESMMP